MAIKGLSIPVFGKYAFNSETKAVTYSDGVINPHAVSYSVAVEAGNNNPFHADNGIVEHDRPKFASGTISLETDDLDQAISKFLLGLKEYKRTIGTETVTSLIYDDDQKGLTVGLGLIEEHQINDVDAYKAVILKKVTFNVPSDSATTRGETIAWQTKTIEGVIERSEEETAEVTTSGSANPAVLHPWKEEAWFTTESAALAFLKNVLGYEEPNT